MSTSEPVSPPRLLKVRVALGLLPQPDGDPPFIWLERWDAFIIAIIVGFGVPLFAFADFSTTTRLTIAWVWAMFWVLFFTYFEGRELIGQMTGRGTIKPEQLSEQQKTAQTPFWGVAAALVAWLVVYVVHIALKLIAAPPTDGTWSEIESIVSVLYNGLWSTWLPYGWIEWLTLAHVWWTTTKVNYIMYNVGNIFSKAAPMAERFERRGA